MKKLATIAVATLLCIVSFSQTKPNTVTKKDSVAQSADSLTLNTPLFSLKDIQELDLKIQAKFSINQLSSYQEIYNWINDRIALRVREYSEKNPPKKK